MSGQAADTPASTPAAWDLPAHANSGATDASSRLLEYVLLRVTGAALSVLALGHFAVTHLVTDVAGDDSAFVARRLSSALWITWDAMLLAAALVHGFLGVRLALADYTTGRRAGRALGRAVAAIAVVLFVLGVIAIARAAHA